MSVQPVSDADLLASMLRGDVEALGAIYDRHVEAVWKAAVYYASSAAAAEQAVFDVFQRLWRNPAPDGQSSLRVRLLLSLGRDLSDADEIPATRTMSSGAPGELHELRGHLDQIEAAPATRVTVEQAKGVLIERHGMTPDAAFEMLRQRARDQHRSLDEVCAHIVAWGGIPDGARPEAPPSPASRTRGKRHAG